MNHNKQVLEIKFGKKLLNPSDKNDLLAFKATDIFFIQNYFISIM